MAGIFTRNALNRIMEDESLTPQQRTEQVYSLYGRALDDGYISKSAAQQAQEAAVERAKAEWEKGQTVPDPRQSDEYRALAGAGDEVASGFSFREAEKAFPGELIGVS